MYKQIIDSKNAQIEELLQKINSHENLHTEIQPLLKNIKPLTLEKYIDNSTIKEKNKKYYKNLFTKYIEYCNQKYLSKYIEIKEDCPLDINIGIYDPSNVLDFIKDKCKFKRSSIPKILTVFLRVLRKCTRNPNLEYPSSIGQFLKPFNKHYIQFDELRNYMNYLKRKEDFETCLIFELLYKFVIRIEAIAKIKVMDIDEHGVITFREKNQKRPKRNLREILLRKIKYLIINKQIKRK